MFLNLKHSSFWHYFRLFTCSVLSFFERLCSPATTLTSFCWHFPSVKVRKSQKNFFLSSNSTPNFFLQISALATKKSSNEKKYFVSLIWFSKVLLSFFWTLFEARAEIGKKFIRFLEYLKTRKNYSEISWPLILSQQWAAVMAVQGFNKLPPQKWLPRHWIESYKVQWK